MAKKLFLFFMICLSSFVFAGLKEFKLYKNNTYVSKIKAYKFNDRIYFDSSEIIRKMGGKTYWYPVSGKLLIQIKAHKISIDSKTDRVKTDEEESEVFPNVVIVRAGRVFVSGEFFISKLFSQTIGLRIEISEDNSTIKMLEDVNISSIRHFSYKDKTRVVVYLYEPLEFKTSQLERKKFIISVIDGFYCVRDETIAVNDGVVESIEFKQEEKSGRFTVNLGENFESADVFTLKEPDRIVIDFIAKNEVINSRIGEKREEIILPVVATDTVSASTVSAILPDKLDISRNTIKRIVIDPGHGGKDPGGRRIFGLKEKEINLKVAMELYKLLKKDKKFEVLLTRNSDIFIPLRERSKIANDFDADIFISLHANAHKNRNEKGFEIYFLSEKASDPWSAEVADYENAVVSYEEGNFDYTPAAILLHSLARNEYINEGSQLAAYIAKEYEKRTPFKNRGVKQAAFYVLRGTYAPSVLVEMGFMTNPQDQKKLCDSKVHKKIAQAIYEGILNYVKSKN